MSKLRKAAKGVMCTLQIPGVCNFAPDTSVLCHLNSDKKGCGLKSPDIIAVIGCFNCHNVIDGRVKTELSRQELDSFILNGLKKTLIYFLERGLIK